MVKQATAEEEASRNVDRHKIKMSSLVDGGKNPKATLAHPFSYHDPSEASSQNALDFHNIFPERCKETSPGNFNPILGYEDGMNVNFTAFLKNCVSKEIELRLTGQPAPTRNSRILWK